MNMKLLDRFNYAFNMMVMQGRYHDAKELELRWYVHLVFLGTRAKIERMVQDASRKLVGECAKGNTVG